jgi:hypothetical protein
MTDEDCTLDLERVEQTYQVAGEFGKAVIGNNSWRARIAIAALIGRDRAEARGCDRRELMTLRICKFGKSMAEHDCGTFACFVYDQI